MKIFLDTNAFFALVGFSNYEDIDIEKLKELIKDNDDTYYITNITIFEMLNNHSFMKNYNKYFTNFKNGQYTVFVVASPDIEGIYTLEDEKKVWENNFLENKILKKKIGKYISLIYGSNVGIIMKLCFLHEIKLFYFMDFPKEKDIFYEKYIEITDEIIKKIEDFYIRLTMDYVNQLIRDSYFTESVMGKYLKNIITNLAIQYSQTYNQLVAKLNMSPNELTWKEIYFANEEFYKKMDLNRWLLNEEEINKDRINFYKQNLFRDKMLDILIINYKLEDDPEYKKQFMQKYINCIFKGDFKCHLNDFFDEVIFDLFMDLDDSILITFDKKFINFLLSLNIEKVNYSYKYIEKLKK